MIFFFSHILKMNKDQGLSSSKKQHEDSLNHGLYFHENSHYSVNMIVNNNILCMEKKRFTILLYIICVPRKGSKDTRVKQL